MANKEKLFTDFPPVSTSEWKEKVITDLKGADFDKKLVWRTKEGFNVQPMYRSENLEGINVETLPNEFPFVRGTKADNVWLVRQDIDAKDAKAANAKARDILNKGVDSLGFKIDKQQLDKAYIATLLDGIHADCIELNFDVCGGKAVELVGLLADYFAEKGYDLNSLRGSINLDPMNAMLRRGKKLSAEQVAGKVAQMVEAGKRLPAYKVVCVNAVSLNNAGASCSQELGYALAWGAQYLDMLTDAGLSVDEAAKAIKFNFGVGGNYFMEIAKFRAARMLWAMMVKAYEPKCDCAAKMHIHAETSLFNKTVFDAHVNLLRTETEAMSAAIAGVDSLTVRPFDVTYKPSDDFSERIARNQQLLLKEESHFDKVTDPAAGSYYIENLTANIADLAWKHLLDIEENGGFFAAVESGRVQADMKATAEARLKAVSTRREVLLGTNQYPNFNEVAGDKIVESACCCQCGCTAEAGLDTLPHVRAAQEFEALRLETERSGRRPKAFMLTIGNLAMRLARAQFSCNFFACAGYEVIDNLGFETVEDGVAAARKAGADIIVLCSSDDEYAELAPAAYKTIGDGKEIFVVAGAPACMEDLQKLGIEHFIHVRVNVLETLKAFNNLLINK
ncbi:MAG: methylmalonyl-CoA mutase small subunit [Paludibacteraceae bacterium]|nr:methylmalonyl-CoA mutase small subunit [Paludibacteraceae bacterium]